MFSAEEIRKGAFHVSSPGGLWYGCLWSPLFSSSVEGGGKEKRGGLAVVLAVPETFPFMYATAAAAQLALTLVSHTHETANAVNAHPRRADSITGLAIYPLPCRSARAYVPSGC